MNSGFTPDWISPPGETIADILDTKGMSVVQLARQLENSPEEVQQLILGQLSLTRSIAQRLAATIGGSADFWLARDARYQSTIADLEQEQTWLRGLPVRDMTKYGWITLRGSPSERVAQCLRFFGVGGVKSWFSTYEPLVREEVAYRTSPTFESDLGALSSWLRQGEIEAHRIKCEEWDHAQFRRTLERTRELTREEDPERFIPRLQKLCAQSGVAVVVLRAPQGCRASGATRFLSSGKALMLLSMRHLSDDHFWFSFFHEAGHLALHGKTEIFLEFDNTKKTGQEGEANRFAEDVLIPPQYRQEMLSLPVNGRQVMRFARKIGIAPGLVVGQLQHVGRLERRQLNNLKRRYSWGGRS